MSVDSPTAKREVCIPTRVPKMLFLQLCPLSGCKMCVPLTLTVGCILGGTDGTLGHNRGLGADRAALSIWEGLTTAGEKRLTTRWLCYQ